MPENFQAVLELPEPHAVVDWRVVERDTIEEWTQSTRDAIGNLERVIIQAEENGVDAETWQTIRAILHNIKGEAGFVGLPAISDVCHRTESDLDRAENAGVLPADRILAEVDWLNRIMDIVEDDDSLTLETVVEPYKKLKILVVEDGLLNRTLMLKLLASVGDCDSAIDGEAGVLAFKEAIEGGNPYDIVFLDIMMPKMDGQEALKQIRDIEEARGVVGSDGVKVVMTTALKDSKNVLGAFRSGCEGYLVKPIDKRKLFGKLKELDLIS